ncbi:Aste57867_23320 [Aphanomyces stellatus]|uniref:Aste57867_23320 protein n=1 Tax=Aphanomyces stellatus TaxID=120398 RepID=A0A485LMH4_9STRA|nr:hypothetical protein As57867_023249 [Aphanomyces stellatus]VFT99965.1 Aste57867_23320 [Aphanomyces stellatus]
MQNRLHCIRQFVQLMPRVAAVASSSPPTLVSSTKAVHRVGFNKVSVGWSLLFAFNLAVSPLKAYISETLPWHIIAPVATNATLWSDDLNYTLAILQVLYNPTTMPDSTQTFRRDDTTYVIRAALVLSTPLVECDATLLRFPGAVFYGPALRRAACAFLAQNSSSPRTMTPICQHVYMLAVPVVNTCLWVDGPSSTHFIVSFGAVNLESIPFAWCKLTWRCLLVGYILHLLWHSYYYHVWALGHNLTTVGLRNPSTAVRYDLSVGDPTPLVLDHPFVSLVFVVDFYAGIDYVGLASIRVSQVADVGQFALGCLYGSRAVWFGYFTMRYATYLVKWKRWECHVTSVDPGVLALAAAFYAGPIYYMLANTPAVHLLYLLWSLQPSGTLDRDASIDVAAGCIATLALLGSLPCMYAVGAPHVHRSQLVRSVSSLYAHPIEYNDLKIRLLWWLPRLWTKPSQTPVRDTGGCLYRMYDHNPRYKNLPLLSHRAADCFVGCYDDNVLTSRVRLSLRQWLDLQPHDTDHAIQMCPASHHGQAICTISNTTCPNISPLSKLPLDQLSSNTTARHVFHAGTTAWV